MSRRGIRSSCIRKIPLGLAKGRDWSPEVLIRDADPRQPLLGPWLPAQPERGRYHWGPCQVWETGQWLAPSQPQMLAWAVVPGAALPEDPLGGAGGGPLGLFAESSPLHRKPCVQHRPRLISPRLLGGGCCHCPHLSDEETEAQRGKVSSSE